MAVESTQTVLNYVSHHETWEMLLHAATTGVACTGTTVGLLGAGLFLLTRPSSPSSTPVPKPKIQARPVTPLVSPILPPIDSPPPRTAEITIGRHVMVMNEITEELIPGPWIVTNIKDSGSGSRSTAPLVTLEKHIHGKEFHKLIVTQDVLEKWQTQNVILPRGLQDEILNLMTTRESIFLGSNLPALNEIYGDNPKIKSKHGLLYFNGTNYVLKAVAGPIVVVSGHRAIQTIAPGDEIILSDDDLIGFDGVRPGIVFKKPFTDVRDLPPGYRLNEMGIKSMDEAAPRNINYYFSEAAKMIRSSKKTGFMIQITVGEMLTPENLAQIKATCRHAMITHPEIMGYRLQRHYGKGRVTEFNPFYVENNTTAQNRRSSPNPTIDVGVVSHNIPSYFHPQWLRDPGAIVKSGTSAARPSEIDLPGYEHLFVGDRVAVINGDRYRLDGVAQTNWKIVAFNSARRSVTIETQQTTESNWFTKLWRSKPERIKVVREVSIDDVMPLHVFDGDGIYRHITRRREFNFVQRRSYFQQTQTLLTQKEYEAISRGYLRQANVGNCWWITALNMLRASEDDFATLVQSSVRRVEKNYEVYPLGSYAPGTRPIIVKPEHLWPQINEHYNTDPAKGDVDTRPILFPVSGPKIFKILEAAAVILASPPGKFDRTTIEGGQANAALKQLLGPAIETFDFGKRGPYSLAAQGSGQPNLIAELRAFLAQMVPGRDFANTASLHGPSDKYMLPGTNIQLFPRHAYTVEHPLETVKEGQDLTITIINPHNTRRRDTTAFTNFIHGFSLVGGARFQFNNLFRMRPS